MVFIKNIDNVVQERFAETTIRYKKILAGKLIELRQELFALQDELEKDTPGAGRMEKVVQLLEERYQYRLETPLDFTYLENARATLMSILDRPIRVCGVVKNTGEAGVITSYSIHYTKLYDASGHGFFRCRREYFLCRWL